MNEESGMRNEELKPVRCGCGGTPVTLVSEDCFGERWYQIDCMSCHITTMQCLTEAEAIEAWNKAMGAEKVAELIEHIWREKLDSREAIVDLVKRMLG